MGPLIPMYVPIVMHAVVCSDGQARIPNSGTRNASRTREGFFGIFLALKYSSALRAYVLVPRCCSGGLNHVRFVFGGITAEVVWQRDIPNPCGIRLVKKPPHLGRGGLNTSQSSMQAPHAYLKEPRGQAMQRSSLSHNVSLRLLVHERSGMIVCWMADGGCLLLSQLLLWLLWGKRSSWWWNAARPGATNRSHSGTFTELRLRGRLVYVVQM